MKLQYHYYSNKIILGIYLNLCSDFPVSCVFIKTRFKHPNKGPCNFIQNVLKT